MISKKQEVLRKAEAILAQKPFSKQQEAEFKSLMLLHDALADEPEDRGNGNAAELRAQIETRLAVNKVDEEFRQFVVNGQSEARTYSALETGAVPGSVVVPTGQWLHEIQTRMISASGWLKAGCQIVPTKNGRPLINFFGDDSSNAATILSDNGTLPESNPVYSAPTAHVKSFATATATSRQFEHDVDGGSFNLSAHLAGVFGRRVARRLQTYMTSDATYGLLGQLTVGATAASASLPSLAELSDMQSPAQLDPDYLSSESSPAYLASPALIALLRKQQTTTGAKLYPEIEQGRLLGLPLVANVDMTANAGDVAIACGSFLRGIHIQDAGSVMVRSSERLAEYGQVFFGYIARYGAVLCDQNAITALKLHA